MDEVVKIKRKDLEELVMSYYKLNALENGGVDNWDWYGESLSNSTYDEASESPNFFEDFCESWTVK